MWINYEYHKFSRKGKQERNRLHTLFFPSIFAFIEEKGCGINNRVQEMNNLLIDRLSNASQQCLLINVLYSRGW